MTAARRRAGVTALRSVPFYVGVLLIVAFFLAPLIWLVTTALKSPVDAFAYPPVFIFKPVLDNFRNVLDNGDFVRAFLNSTVISLTATALAVALGSLAAYALVFFNLPRHHDVTVFVAGLRIAPVIMFILPLFFLATKIQAKDSYALLISAYVLVNVPLAILLLSTFFRDIPGDIREAALVDGCGEWQVFTRMILPIARGGITAASILCLLFTWNEFLIALVLSGKTTQTLPVAITSFLTFQGTEWGPLTAAGTLVMLPMLLLGLSVQRQLVRGMTMGSVK